MESSATLGRFTGTVSELLQLLDWKRRVFALYADVRATTDPEQAWRRWCDVRRTLYLTHPQSPRVGTAPLYFEYDDRLRTIAAVDPVVPERITIPGSAGSMIAFTRFALTLRAGRRHTDARAVLARC